MLTLHLGPPQFAGDFEIHLTVRADADGRTADDRAATSPGPNDSGPDNDGPDDDRLALLAAELGWKYARIVLDRGRVPAQPMVTLRTAGTLAAARDAADGAVRRLREAGHRVVRTKVEAAPWARGVPGSDAEGAVLGPRHYFEHHVKLVLEPDADTAAIVAVADRHAAHLSRNARRIREDGRAERFVTQRCRLVGRDTAGRRLEALVSELGALGHEMVAMEREFVVYDSDESLDAGWIRERHEADGAHDGCAAGGTREEEAAAR
ncbi:hypothetical protein LRS74_02185 [Streptomyces sp. LX-29]|uniref:hypothetical protein n=1 Tax=Streptomyces sp. LX-29 TaxID=2900152 RepID=UPI00240E2822|nr:hypothetical protein [Streptomyces sp. LX-29]WFB05971.1 hypothetical protein LRS74_02185 [Streptomyces sp. LX-29]